MYVSVVEYNLPGILLYFFPLLKQYQIHLNESGMLQPIHQLPCIEQTAENGILLSHVPPGLTAAAPHEHKPFLCPGCCGLLAWEQMAAGAGAAASCALQRFQSDPGASCPAQLEHKAKGAAVLHPVSQRHFSSSFKIYIWLGISQNRHL